MKTGTEIIDEINSLNIRSLRDYKRLVYDLRKDILQLSNINKTIIDKSILSQEKEIRNENIKDHHFRENSLSYIGKVYNNKLLEFIDSFFFEKEYIRQELKRNPNILKEINSNKIFYLSDIVVGGIEPFEFGPSISQKFAVVNRMFEQKYQSNYFLKEKESEGCFVATYAYEDYNHEKVIIFRRFRDEFLSNYVSGRFFIDRYYKYSPSFVDYLNKIKFPKKIATLLLDRFIPIVKLILNKKQ